MCLLSFGQTLLISERQMFLYSETKCWFIVELHIFVKKRSGKKERDRIPKDLLDISFDLAMYRRAY